MVLALGWMLMLVLLMSLLQLLPVMLLLLLLMILLLVLLMSLVVCLVNGPDLCSATCCRYGQLPHANCARVGIVVDVVVGSIGSVLLFA